MKKNDAFWKSSAQLLNKVEFGLTDGLGCKNNNNQHNQKSSELFSSIEPQSSKKKARKRLLYSNGEKSMTSSSRLFTPDEAQLGTVPTLPTHPLRRFPPSSNRPFLGNPTKKQAEHPRKSKPHLPAGVEVFFFVNAFCFLQKKSSGLA